MPLAAGGGAGLPERATQSQVLRHALKTIGSSEAELRDAAKGESSDGPTNIYYLAQYTYQLSTSAVTMGEHELALLLPRTGRIWVNGKLFTAVPRGRELMQRDAWWRVIDSSPAVRFLVGWCVSVFATAQFDAVPREQLPGWSRVMQFSPALPDCSRLRVKFWSDCVQQLTDLFAPSPRIWRQLQSFTPVRAGDPHWQARLALAGHRVQDVVHFLADRNSCPAVLIQRQLDGNEPLSSYEEYLAFTEEVLEDLPRLRMQRVVAMQAAAALREPPKQTPGGNLMPRIAAALPSMLRGHWGSEIEDPRQEIRFWSMHL